MLKKNRRLRKKEFNDIYDRGRNVSSSLGYFKVAEREGVAKFSCVSGKKDVKKSVDRTRIRRRGYAAIAEHLPVPEGFGVIWFLPPEAQNCDFRVLSQAAKNLIDQLK